MSPLSLRRHRAERALREQFEGLRGAVLASVGGRLRASGVRLDRGDLEACYSLAWHGLYTKLLEGEEIANPHGWLVLVTYRRALDEHRARARTGLHAELGEDRGPASGSGVAGDRAAGARAARAAAASDRDLAEELDDRARLRQLFEGLRGRLDAREREAAALCYLHGLSRAEAAARMGISEARMRKLMEGSGRGRPGVAGKVGALVHTIRDGGWCEEQGSLMRALAYGVLDPGGERHRLALMHSGQCPACRAYVVSLRGLAVALPPVFVPGGLAAAALACVGEGLHVGAAGGPASGGAHGGLHAGRAVSGAAPASAVAGASAAGAGGAASGGWLVGAGSLGAKLAAGCVLALSVGAGCAMLSGAHRLPGRPHPPRAAPRARPASAASRAERRAATTGPPRSTPPAGGASNATSVSASLTPAAKASREFGPEHELATASSSTASVAGAHATARTASAGSSRQVHGADGSGSGLGVEAVSGGGADSTSAEREFSPG